jgi:hypothetical protein
MVGVYQRHRFEEEARVALAAWGEHVRSLVKGGRGSGLHEGAGPAGLLLTVGTDVGGPHP